MMNKRVEEVELKLREWIRTSRTPEAAGKGGGAPPLPPPAPMFATRQPVMRKRSPETKHRSDQSSRPVGPVLPKLISI